jgi:hypothetical protein
MSLLLRNGAVFLHVPKTGGTWTTRLLERLGLVQTAIGAPHGDYERLFWYDRFHRDAKVFRNLLRRRLGLIPRIDPACFKFCFVREPLSWYVSWWRFMEGVGWWSWGQEGNPAEWSPMSMLNDLGSPDFNTFMDNVNRKRPGFVTELYGWYTRPDVFVGRQENLREDVLTALTLAGFDPDPLTIAAFPCVNQSPPAVPRPEWDPRVKRETLRLEYAAYIRYGYPVPVEAGLQPRLDTVPAAASMSA